ncbi:metallophosphoesterase family protein [Natranaerobius thermophilus]|uniref:Metallophosphoesterase n=1 Tax=Natranaerobius thermophilus (strain ATCC BAA-1301 / DSM 18059 / JW/NM-WN-LF) TaxID=457570 RepID=B2A8B5_NATTJ|nr:metallophosphoesterase [Natranaerobius thermophilus]ACB84481.1 metallophosphoesterase [Natranaerobius thermophilus JW/NM-WN-LF]
MLRILHTADIHLKTGCDERWRALEELIARGQKEDIDLLIICGDLFDSSQDAVNLYNYLRSLFTNTGYRIVILPGNHDLDVYQEGLYFGEDVSIIKDVNKPLVLEEHDTVIWGLPFSESDELNVLKQMKAVSRQADSNKYNILLFHGELLETYYSGSDFGDEGTGSYMPVKKSNLTGLNFDYILGGHFHTNFRLFELDKPDKTSNVQQTTSVNLDQNQNQNQNQGIQNNRVQYFVYPGSPVSITNKELGKRKANLFNVGESPKEELLDTFYYHFEEFKLDPLKDNHDPLKEINDKLWAMDIGNESELILKITGFFDSSKLEITENNLLTEIESICQRVLAEKTHTDSDSLNFRVIPEFKDMGSILDDELLKSFQDKLEAVEDNEAKKEKMLQMVMEALMEVKN